MLSMSISHISLSKYLSQNLNRYINILESFVSINTHSENKNGINELSLLTEKLFSELGFSAEIFPSSNKKYGNHLFLQKGELTKPSITLISHLDTVFSVEDEKKDNFFFQIKGDKAYGPGTCDIKGGTLIIYMMMEAINKFYPELFDNCSFHICLNAAEEKIDTSFGNLCKKIHTKSKCLANLVFEVGNEHDKTPCIVVARKGIIKYNIKVFGKGAHSGSEHEYGVSALHQLSEFVEKIRKLNDYSKKLTTNVGYFSSGSCNNRVAHYAEAEFEARCFDPGLLNETDKQIKEIVNDLSVKNIEGVTCKVELKTQADLGPWPETESSDRLYNIWEKNAKMINHDLLRVIRSGGSDANQIWNLAPTIDGLGPLGGDDHCSINDPERGFEQEHLYISSLVPKTVLNVLGVVDILKTYKT